MEMQDWPGAQGDCAGNPERGRVEKEQLYEQEVQQEEENRQSS
ncbi:MAG: hypothetical protein ACLTHX_12010 [Blautia massiliensis (ex Durand et al. 2017)]